MSFKIVFKGVEIFCETLPEAKELTLALAGHQNPQSPLERIADSSVTPSIDEPRGWTKRKLSEFARLLKGNSEKLILLLREQPIGRLDEDIREILNLKSNNALAGITAGITKNALKVGMKGKNVLFNEWVEHNGEEKRLYKLVSSFALALTEFGWPK